MYCYSFSLHELLFHLSKCGNMCVCVMLKVQCILGEAAERILKENCGCNCMKELEEKQVAEHRTMKSTTKV